MLLELLCLLAAGSLVFGLLLIGGKIISDKWALIRFRKLSRGLPLCPDACLIGNHVKSVPFRPQNCETLLGWHRTMGKTLGWLKGSSFCATTIDLDLIKTFIMDEPEAHLNRTKIDLPLEEFEKSIMLAPAEEWRTLRKAIAPALTSNKFKTPIVMCQIEQTIMRLVDLIEAMLDASGPEQLFELDEMIHKYSIQLVFTSFYKQENLIDFHEKDPFWVKAITESFEQVQKSPFARWAVMFPMLNPLIDWFVWYFTTFGLGRRKTIELIKLQTRLGLRAKKETKDRRKLARETGTRFDADNFTLKDGTVFKRNMVDYIIDQYLDGKLTKEQYTNNAMFLMAAANRTASDCIEHTIYLLATNQDTQDKLRLSIMSDGPESEFLDWVLKESLRLLPPAPIGCSRTISRDIEVEGGHVVPKGTFVITCAYVIHRLKEYWGEDADQFRPERWQDTSHHHPLQYIPFGAGLRSCPGKMFAIHEMKMLFATLLMRYKFEGERREDAYEFDAPWWIFVVPKSEIRVKIRRL